MVNLFSKKGNLASHLIGASTMKQQTKKHSFIVDIDMTVVVCNQLCRLPALFDKHFDTVYICSSNWSVWNSLKKAILPGHQHYIATFT